MSEIYSKYSPPHENKETWSKKEYHPLTEMYCKMYGIKYNGKSKTEQKYVSIHSCNKCNSKSNMHYEGVMLVCPDCDNFIIPDKK
tara:strand:+ start:264 stop:518 length:255 start_codon:yes stop_codon:yes gene_type:complete